MCFGIFGLNICILFVYLYAGQQGMMSPHHPQQQHPQMQHPYMHGNAGPQHGQMMMGPNGPMQMQGPGANQGSMGQYPNVQPPPMPGQEGMGPSMGMQVTKIC